MIDHDDLFDAMAGSDLAPWLAILRGQLEDAFDPGRHGDLARWLELLRQLPAVTASQRQLDRDCIRVGGEDDCDAETRSRVAALLRQLHPWRKGPYWVHGIHIDTEWRSDIKWNRLAGSIQPLSKRLVLDVGCGNGYHCWRALGAGARRVIGVDPTLLSVIQFHAIRHFAGALPVHVLPLGIEAVPPGLRAFDTAFSMGVLYHRRSPLDHLLELRDCLRSGGELVLETLVIEGDAGQVLVPEGRYAKMRNVWFIPSPATLEAWLKRCGFKAIRLIDVSHTTSAEQRSTDWMRFHSLADFLQPGNPALTVEGLPAPRRALFLATAH